MSKPFVPGVGAILSADIAVPEHERQVRFYSRVLTTGENPLWRGEDLVNNLGVPIIGLGARSAEYNHLPLQWMPHIQVADVAASVQRALDLGGSVLMHAKDDDGTSQWAVLLDPNGAAFGIIPVVPAEAIPSAEEDAPSGGRGSVGRIGWLDLTVPDAPEVRDFYRQVVGWSVEPAHCSSVTSTSAAGCPSGSKTVPLKVWSWAGACDTANHRMRTVAAESGFPRSTAAGNRTNKGRAACATRNINAPPCVWGT